MSKNRFQIRFQVIIAAAVFTVAMSTSHATAEITTPYPELVVATTTSPTTTPPPLKPFPAQRPNPFPNSHTISRWNPASIPNWTQTFAVNFPEAETHLTVFEEFLKTPVLGGRLAVRAI